MSKWAKIYFSIATVLIIAAYTFLPILPKGVFYILTALAFVGFLRSLYLQTKGIWSLAVFVVWLLSCNNLSDELFFNPKEMDWNEWIGFLLIILITWIQRKKWIR
jgi:hypothetical protein